MNTLPNLKAHLEAAAVLAREITTANGRVELEEAALLADVLAMVKPCLPVLVAPVRDYEHSSTGRNGCNPVEKHHNLGRGAVLVDGFDDAGDGTGNRGTLIGKRLVLMENGDLVELARAGTWSHWQGEATTWGAGYASEDGETLGERETLTPTAAVKAWDFEDVLEGIAKALAAGVEKGGKLAEKIGERRKRLEAARKALGE
jgi:hypothetical protein